MRAAVFRAAAWTAIAFGLVAISVTSRNEGEASQPPPDIPASPAAPAAPMPTTHPPRASNEVEDTVRTIVDGDTVILEDGRAVRYIGIDTPEIKNKSRRSDCYANEATERNRKLVEGKRVRLETDTTEQDRYGRILRYLYADGVFVNLALVAGGYARSLTYPPDTKHQTVLRGAEQEARRARRGLWGEACPTLNVPSPHARRNGSDRQRLQVTDDRDCSDFSSQRAAQEFFRSHGGPENDPHRLDVDRDGSACESLL